MSEATMCDPKAKVCAYGECSECLLTCHPMLTIPGEENIRFSQWMTEKITKDEKVSTITVKREITTTQHDLNTDFQERLLHFKRHVFNIKWQFNAYRELRRSLKHNESLLHIDFSENYSCKYSQEIQSVHFGGSHQQASLHTGVLYTAGGQAPHTFCSISPSRRHDPVAIWAHLDPILKVVRERHPQVSILHFFSDGPATQYRQKGNFFYLSTEPYKYGFKEITWNFFQASHGKGAPDGVGGVLKRSADRIVAHRGDIPDAQSLYDKLKSLDTSVELFFVPERDIESKTQVPAIAAVKGTLRIHQAISLTPGQMKYRDISCLCKREEGVLDCPCFNLQEVTLADVPVSSDESPAKPQALNKRSVQIEASAWKYVEEQLQK
ncbi:Enolase [Dissostichus eleginoides]|uniref:Enolase n=1 Tax=Dissostichus eleginoides TaxID=100907 RepID=A0AAD9BBR1_DISEL|nr:Enolase [Dissostichus eleginoides]